MGACDRMYFLVYRSMGLLPGGLISGGGGGGWGL